MTKSPDAFRTISEVAEWLNTPAHVLRFWESKFTQIKPVKRAGGRRYYRPDDMLLLGGIKKLLHKDGLTIKGAQKMLRSDGIKSVAALSHPLDVTAEISDSTTPVKMDAPAAPEPEVEQTVEQPMLMELEEIQPAPAPQTKSVPDPTPQPVAKAEPAQTAPLPLGDTQTDSVADTAKQQQLSALYGRLSALRNRMQADIDSHPQT